MPTEDIQQIRTLYGLGDYIGSEINEEGALNYNSILETTKGKFFVKTIREKRKDDVPFIYGIETFFKNRGIKVISMMKTLDGEISVNINGNIYTVYGYLEGDKNPNYTDEQYREMGKVLGDIHLAGSKDVPSELKVIEYKYPPRDAGVEKFLRFKKLLSEKSELTEVDKMFSKYLDLKLSIASKKDKDIEYKNDTLVHGDYHPGNLLFDKNNGEIIGVCDWEQAGIFPRSYEVARSIMYICFIGDFEVEKATERAKIFMAAYNAVHPMSYEELQKGFDLRLWRMAISAWIEEKYYDHNDDRANRYVSSDMILLDLFEIQKFDIKKFF